MEAIITFCWLGASIFELPCFNLLRRKNDKSGFALNSDFAPGDDASRVMYGITCARLEKLGKMQHNPRLQEIN